jgi:hypothetical protein
LLIDPRALTSTTKLNTIQSCSTTNGLVNAITIQYLKPLQIENGCNTGREPGSPASMGATQLFGGLKGSFNAPVRKKVKSYPHQKTILTG